jgi:fibronectin-binding autotransporter adhesin
MVGPLAASALIAQAPATETWRGGGGNANWSNAANWASNSVPGTGDKLVFPASANLISDDDLPGYTFSGMTFTAAGYDIGGDALTLSGPLAITAAVTAGQDEIDPQVTFAAGARVSVAVGGVVLDLVATPVGALVKTGNGTLDAQGLDSGTSPITVRGGILTGCGNGTSSTSPITVLAGASYVAGSPDLPYDLIVCGRPLVVNGTGYQGEGAIDVVQHVDFGALTLGSDATIGGLATGASSSYWEGAVAIRSHTLTSSGFTNTFVGSISGSGTIVQDAANITLVEGTGSVRSAVADTGMLGLAVPVTTVTVGGTGVLYTVSPISRLSVSASAQLWPCDEPTTSPPTGPNTPTVTLVGHSLRLPPGATFVAQLGVGSAAGNDSLTVTSGPMIVGGASLAVAAPGACDGSYLATQPGDSYTVLTAPGGLVGTFAGLPDGAVLTGEDGNPYRVTYTATSVVLTRN